MPENCIMQNFVKEEHFRKMITKICFNFLRRKINTIIISSGAAKLVTLSMRFPKDYSTDKNLKVKKSSCSLFDAQNCLKWSLFMKDTKNHTAKYMWFIRISITQCKQVYAWNTHDNPPLYLWKIYRGIH